jgi:hypothetical protein
MMSLRNLFLISALSMFMAVKATAQADADMPDTAGVILHADPRLALLTASKGKSSGTSQHAGAIHSGRGFRVQLYNGNDRSKAMQMKLDFMRRVPGVRTYMTYIQPQYRLKVGDFRSRSEAQKLVKDINAFYSPLMIVPDIIMINSTKDD